MIWRRQFLNYHAPMRRIIAALRQGAGVLLLLVATGCSCFAQSASSPPKMRNAEMYRQVAHRILYRIADLRERYPHMALIENTARMEEATDKLWIAYRYMHGISWIPNPHYEPHKKGNRQVKSFSAKDGIELNLYFYEGEWPGQLVVRPAHIGAMNVVTLIEGRETASVRALGRDINQIVADEVNRFNGQHQDEKALHDSSE